jgi:hypothetical protein
MFHASCGGLSLGPNYALDAIFAQEDYVRVAFLKSHGGGMDNWVHRRDEAIDLVRNLDAQGVVNIYFGASQYLPDTDYETGFGEHRCLATRCIPFDVDYGEDGHRKESSFATYNEAIGYLFSLPLLPNLIWHTGHGFQGLYLVDEAIDLTTTDGRACYEAIVGTIQAMCHGDSKGNPADLFRVPGTVNQKPDLPAVRGNIVYADLQRHYSVCELQAIAEGYCLMSDVDIPDEENDDDDYIDPMEGDADVPYTAIADDIRADIEADHDDRSKAMFACIAKIVHRYPGISPESVVDAIEHGHDFTEKYEDRLDDQVCRVLSKLEVEFETENSPVALDAMCTEIASIVVGDCPTLESDLEHVLGVYAREFGIEGPEYLFESAVLFDAATKHHKHCVIEGGCGGGKSTFAKCAAVCAAMRGQRCAIVMQTIDEVDGVADELRQLAHSAGVDVNIGVYHGFNQRRCHELSGRTLNWKQCVRNDPGAECHRCSSRQSCAYYNRSVALDTADVLVITHAGFIGLIERNSKAFEDQNVFIDEDLAAFATMTLTDSDLGLAAEYLEDDLGVLLGGLFPGSDLWARARFGPGLIPRYFADDHYVYFTKSDLPDVETILSQVRARLFSRNTVNSPSGYLRPHELDRAEDILFNILHCFRGGDPEAGYALHLSHQRGRQYYTIRKRRLVLGSGLPTRTCVLLNATASLSESEYSIDVPVLRFPGLQRSRPPVKLGVVVGNPMESRLDTNVDAGMQLLRDFATPADVLVCTAAKQDPGGIAELIRDTFGCPPRITHLPRGRTRGTNAAGHCDLVFLPAMPLFTTIDTCGLAAALRLRQTIPRSHIFNAKGYPAMSAGAFRFAPVQQQYTRAAIDELYQTLYRGSIRNGREMTAIITMPDASWLGVLWRLGLRNIHGIHAIAGSITDDHRVRGMTALPELLELSPGSCIEKSEIAKRFGYTTWRTGKRYLRSLLAPFFDDPGDRVLIRRSE